MQQAKSVNTLIIKQHAFGQASKDYQANSLMIN